MSDFTFDCVDVVAQPYAASPTLVFKLRIAEAGGATIHALALHCQIRIEPQRRRYDDDEAELLAALFGERSRWGETLKPMQFTTVSTVVKSFAGSTDVDIPVACSYDLDVATGSYFHALRSGEVPFVLLFSGTVFGKGEKGFWVEQVPWHHECVFRMPVSEWWRLMDMYFPGSAWLRLERSTMDELVRYRSRNALSTWDHVMRSLLAGAAESDIQSVRDMTS